MCTWCFDRYDDFSTKSVARGGRETGVTRTHYLRIETKLPAQKCGSNCTNCIKGHILVVTGKQPCPVEISSEEVKTRRDLETHHKEADNMIVQQVLKTEMWGKKQCP